MRNVRFSVDIYVYEVYVVKMDIDQDIAKYNFTNQICPQFETNQSQKFAVLCVLWALPSQPKPHSLLGNAWGYISVIGLSLDH